jgi:hypothetical protein
VSTPPSVSKGKGVKCYKVIQLHAHEKVATFEVFAMYEVIKVSMSTCAYEGDKGDIAGEGTSLPLP